MSPETMQRVQELALEQMKIQVEFTSRRIDADEFLSRVNAFKEEMMANESDDVLNAIAEQNENLYIGLMLQFAAMSDEQFEIALTGAQGNGRALTGDIEFISEILGDKLLEPTQSLKSAFNALSEKDLETTEAAMRTMRQVGKSLGM